MSEQRDQPTEPIPGLGWMAGGLAAVAAFAWLIPTTVVVVHAGRLPRLSVVEALVAAGRLASRGRWASPASAYPDEVRELMPDAEMWWATAAVMLLVLGVVVAMAARHLEPQIARERLGRRPYDWRGARPRPWARPRDLRGGSDRGFSLGRLDGRAIRTGEEEHIVLIAPTRAGKTTRCVIPWLLEHIGPAIVTSTKRDVLDATRHIREHRGQVWIFDPFGEETSRWTPVAGCQSWSQALRQAQWLADASADGDSEIARYWRGEAAKLLAPLLHAAAIERREITEILAWVDAQEVKRPTAILLAAGAYAAERQLHAVAALDPRNRGTTYMSAGSVLAAYRYPEVADATGNDFTSAPFLGTGGDTLYLIAAERHQQLLAPLIVSLVSSIVHDAIETQQFLQPARRLRVLLDEAANIAPLRELPRLLSQAAGHGIRVATVWQSLAQMRERHGDGADTILANSTTKLFMGPITDESTRTYVTSALGAPREDGRTSGRGPLAKATPGELQQLARGDALLLKGDKIPALVTLSPHRRCTRRLSTSRR